MSAKTGESAQDPISVPVPTVTPVTCVKIFSKVRTLQ